MIAQQFDLFEQNKKIPIFDDQESDLQSIRNEIEEIRQILHRVRKGTYASIGEIKKLSLNYDDRLNIIEKNICKGVDQ